MNDTYGHNLKLDRAAYHLQSLDTQIRRWSESGPHRYTYELDSQSGKKHVRVHFDPLPDEFRLILGDCLHNLRAALDALVYELALWYLDIYPLPEGRASGLEFPVFGDRVMTTREHRRKIGCIHPDAQAVIKRLQPYNRGDEFARDPLWVLHRLANVDKHRAPHVIGNATSTFAHFPDAPTLVSDLQVVMGFLENGAVVASYTPPVNALDTEVNMDAHLTFGVAFGHRAIPPRQQVITVLRWLLNHVRNRVVPRLERFLPEPQWFAFLQ